MLFTKANRRLMDSEAKKEMELSLEIERDLNEDLRVFFKRVTRDLKSSWGAVGLIPDQKVRYTDILENLLIKYMKKAGEIFSHNIRNNSVKGLSLFETKAQEIDIPEEQAEDIALVIGAEVALLISETAEKQTEQILATSQKQIDEIITKTESELTKLGVAVTLIKVAKIASEKFAEKSIARRSLISFMAVSSIASESKDIEATVINSAPIQLEGENIAGRIKKNWNAVLDSKTRPAHSGADAKYFSNPIELEEPFYVGGEYLMRPRDLAGSAGNVCNCRCESHKMLGG